MNSDSQHPFVSVIIPAFNEERYIGSCLSAVLAQSWPRDRMEVLVVDNGSTDATRDIAERLLSSAGCGRVLEKVGGTIASVRNHGWRNAQGDFLAFLDADSVVERQWLQVGFELLTSSSEVSCVGFAVAPPSEGDSWIERTWFPISSSGKHQGTKDVSWLSSFNLFIRREAFEKIEGFDESLVTCEDADIGGRLGKFSRLIFSDRTCVRHLGSAKSVREFLEKEYWRGQGSLKAWLCSSDKGNGIFSVYAPLIYLFLICTFVGIGIVSVVTSKSIGLILYVAAPLLIFPLLLTIRAGIRKPCSFVSTTMLYILYLLARGVAIASFRR